LFEPFKEGATVMEFLEFLIGFIFCYYKEWEGRLPKWKQIGKKSSQITVGEEVKGRETRMKCILGMMNQMWDKQRVTLTLVPKK
jgi:hypothetical protein